MVTYRPLKNIAIPILSLLIGCGLAIFFMPTKMDAVWKEWNNETTKWEQHTYSLSSTYMKNGEYASEAKGLWSEELTHLTLSTHVSDDTIFAFDIYFEDNRLFIHANEEWHQGSMDDRFTSEIAPLDQPFEWMRDILSEADQVKKNVRSNDEVIYIATFKEFDHIDFRGYDLEKQTDTTLTLTVTNDTHFNLIFDVTPIRPDYVGRFDGYPERLFYELNFEKTNEQPNSLPDEAYTSPELT